MGGFIWLGQEKMDVFGHDDISDDNDSVAGSGFFQDSQE